MDNKFVKLWDWLAYSERDENTPFNKVGLLVQIGGEINKALLLLLR